MQSDTIRRDNVTRIFRHGMREESARKCIGKLEKGIDIFGLSKGDFSMIDVIRHLINEVGPCTLDIGTWTAARTDIDNLITLLLDKRLSRVRFLIDRSFPARQPKYFRAMLDKFGDDSVRLARIHAKFALLDNDKWSVAARTSMNLNMNKRIEFYEISEGSPISGYLQHVMEHHFSKPREDNYKTYTDLTIKSGDTKETNNMQSHEPEAQFGNW